MGRHIHKFQSEDEFNEMYDGQGYLEPWVSLTISGLSDATYIDTENSGENYGFYYLGYVGDALTSATQTNYGHLWVNGSSDGETGEIIGKTGSTIEVDFAYSQTSFTATYVGENLWVKLNGSRVTIVKSDSPNPNVGESVSGYGNSLAVGALGVTERRNPHAATTPDFSDADRVCTNVLYPDSWSTYPIVYAEREASVINRVDYDKDE